MTLNHWCVADNEGCLSVQWGDEHDLFDPTTKTIKTHVKFEWESSGQKELIQDILTLREWTWEDMKSCLARASAWICQDSFGDFREISRFHKKAQRRILALTKAL